MTQSGTTGPWLRRYTAPSEPASRLVCLPPAGGSASFFRTWSELVPPAVALAGIQYPGRENRMSEPPLQSLHAIADGAAAAIAELDAAAPLALFGHSLGGALGYEIALRLSTLEHEGASPRRPLALFVSGCTPPHVHETRMKRRWDEDSILDDLARLGGPSRKALQDPALRALVMPALVADYRLGEDYVPTPGARLSCPVVAFHGAGDTEVTFDEMRQWMRVTSGSFHTRIFEGDHFYLVPQQDAVVAEIVDLMTAFTRWDAPR